MSLFKKAAAMLLCGITVVTCCNAAGGIKASESIRPVYSELQAEENTAAKTETEEAPAVAEEKKEELQKDPNEPLKLTLWLNGQQIALTNEPYIDNGVTYVPFRDFCTYMGCTIGWENGCATATRGDELSITCIPGEIYLLANGRALYLNPTAQITDSRTYLPIRIMAKIFDLGVEWDAQGYRVLLTGGGVIQSGDEFYNKDDLYWLSRIISCEARGEPLCGQVAVGNVIFNRMASPVFPSTVYDVIFDRKNGVQFTPTKTGEIYNKPKEISVIAAKLCLEGADFSCGATYFISDKVTSCWAMRNMTYLMRIGGHRFYG